MTTCTTRGPRCGGTTSVETVGVQISSDFRKSLVAESSCRSTANTSRVGVCAHTEPSAILFLQLTAQGPTRVAPSWALPAGLSTSLGGVLAAVESRLCNLSPPWQSLGHTGVARCRTHHTYSRSATSDTTTDIGAEPPHPAACHGCWRAVQRQELGFARLRRHGERCWPATLLCVTHASQQCFLGRGYVSVAQQQ